MYLYASENNPISIFSMAITLSSNTCSQRSFPVAHIPSRKDTDFASVHAKYFFSCITTYVFLQSVTSVI